MRYVEMLAAKPHPMASVAHDEVLEEVVGLWKALGFEPEVQTAVLVDGKRGAAAKVSNVLTRLKGTEAGKAVMLVAHYDSVPSSPGAADDAAGVAVLLETARALKTGPAPGHDIVFLVTDGEEVGLLGARAFVKEHPWAADVGLVVNFEARGTSGPSVMFETSPGNGPLVRAFAAAAPRPQATSFAVSIYRRMPNGTDLSIFLDAGMQGLNFAFIGEPRDYHTPQDSPAHLDPRSLQHHGSSALALARYFGRTGVPEKGEARRGVFQRRRPGPHRLFAPDGLAGGDLRRPVPRSGGGRQGSVRGSWPPESSRVPSSSLSSSSSFVPSWPSSSPSSPALAHGKWLAAGEPGSNPSYFAALLLLISFLFIILYGLFRRKSGWQNIAFAATSLGVLLTIWTTAALPGASYIIGWPALLGAAALLSTFLSGNEGIDTPVGTAAAALCAFATAVVFAPIIHFLFVALGLSPMGSGALGVFMTLALLSLVPAVESIGRRGTAAWALLAVLAFVGFTIAGAATTRYTVRHPRPSQMGYCLNWTPGGPTGSSGRGPRTRGPPGSCPIRSPGSRPVTRPSLEFRSSAARPPSSPGAAVDREARRVGSRRGSHPAAPGPFAASGRRARRRFGKGRCPRRRNERDPDRRVRSEGKGPPIPVLRARGRGLRTAAQAQGPGAPALDRP